MCSANNLPWLFLTNISLRVIWTVKTLRPKDLKHAGERHSKRCHHRVRETSSPYWAKFLPMERQDCAESSGIRLVRTSLSTRWVTVPFWNRTARALSSNCNRKARALSSNCNLQVCGQRNRKKAEIFHVHVRFSLVQITAKHRLLYLPCGPTHVQMSGAGQLLSYATAVASHRNDQEDPWSRMI